MSKKLKIGFVLDDTIDTTDGVQQYVLTLGRWLDKKGHEVHYLVGQSSRKDIANIHSLSNNIKVRFNKNRLSIPLPVNNKIIKQKINNLHLDVIHVQMPYSPMLAGKIIKFADENTKVIGTFHIIPAGFISSIGARILTKYNRKTLKRFNYIISVSRAAQIFAKNALDIDSIVVPNAIDIKKFWHRPIYNKKLTIVFLGRLVERKGCMYFIEAVKLLPKKYTKNLQVIIGGKGPQKSKLVNFIKQHKIKNIKIIGFVDEEEKAQLLSSADIAVFPSTGGESFGISLIEAMASGGRVVLGGDNIGYHTVLYKYPKLLINPRDTVSFSKSLQYFIENEKARVDVLKWSKSNVKQYDINIVGKKIIKIYQS